MTNEGECRWCRGCGGEFGWFQGSFVANDWPTRFMSMYDDDCKGERDQRPYDDINWARICCKGPKPIVALCSSCGGAYPNEVGAMGRDVWDNHKFFTHFGNKCSENWGDHPYDVPIKVCTGDRTPE